MIRFLVLLFLAAFILIPSRTGAAQQTQPLTNAPSAGVTNWELPTAGGKQFWTDLRCVGGWRIQQNSETGHCRLLDQDNVRQTWGSLNNCQSKLDGSIRTKKVKPLQGPVVILIHGLVRSSASMQTMETFLQQQGYSTINFRYASSRKSIAQHAIALRSVIDGLGPETTDIYLVGHSLGNIVTRRYFYDTRNPASGAMGDSRIRRMVMLGPPNQGSLAARLFKKSLLFHTFAGVSGSELSSDWEQVKPKLATPPIEFGIIAGGQDDEKFSNMALPGKDDFTVSVNETKLAGATDFLVRPLVHGTMMNQPLVLNATASFFRNGYFVSAAERTPLEP
jgi:pimeloyl-ACP methyl ester carboxylesterase